MENENTLDRGENFRKFAKYATDKIESLYADALETGIRDKAIRSFGLNTLQTSAEVTPEIDTPAVTESKKTETEKTLDRDENSDDKVELHK